MSGNQSPKTPCQARKRADLIQELWQKKRQELDKDPDRFRKLRRYDPAQGASHHLNRLQICRELADESEKAAYNSPQPASSAEYVCRKRSSKKYPHIYTRAKLWEMYTANSEADRKAIAAELQETMQHKHNVNFKKWSAQRESLFPYYVMCPIISGRDADKVIEMPKTKSKKNAGNAGKARKAGKSVRRYKGVAEQAIAAIKANLAGKKSLQKSSKSSSQKSSKKSSKSSSKSSLPPLDFEPFDPQPLVVPPSQLAKASKPSNFYQKMINAASKATNATKAVNAANTTNATKATTNITQQIMNAANAGTWMPGFPQINSTGVTTRHQRALQQNRYLTRLRKSKNVKK
jgi:hypothetical protein